MKDARYKKIKVIILIALAALALVYFNYIRPVFESRASASRMTVLMHDRDAEAVATIKSDPTDFEKSVKADEAEINDYNKRTGLLPAAAFANLSEKTPAGAEANLNENAPAGAEENLSENVPAGAEANLGENAPADAEADIARKAAAAGISAGSITIAPDKAGPKPVSCAAVDDINAVPPYAGFEDSLMAQGYLVTAQAEYDTGVALMQTFENEDAGSWSVGGFAYTGENGGAWTIDLTLYYTSAEG
ncbi:MAG: hypothetical protein LBT52_00435 [Clostridiales Family XIII bacterium]|jgi:hypothetical protein|nr:hypothetical protein [Clostridiales Family XIII bacterium]